MTKNEIDIYDYDRRIEGTKKLIRNDPKISEDTIKIIEEYDRLMIRESLAKATRLKHLQVLLTLSRLLPVEWKHVTKSDIDNLVTKIAELYSDDSGRETHTTFDHKKILKIFFRWMKLGSRDFRKVGDPIETKDVRIKKVKDRVSREDLITDDELSRLLTACMENPRDRAFIDCHAEAGTRPGEILNLKIRHVTFDKYGATLQVDGKTVPHPVRLIRSVPNLAAWLSVHPMKNNPEAPLWINLGYGKEGTPLTSAAAAQMIRRRCELAGLQKRVYLNLFRHTQATESAKYMTEMQMRKRHGWTSDSKMPSRYVHLINADVDEAILKHYGIVKDEKDERRKAPKKCSMCDMLNSSDSEMCSKCGRPLDLATALKVDDATEQRLSSIEQKLNVLLSSLPR